MDAIKMEVTDALNAAANSNTTSTVMQSNIATTLFEKVTSMSWVQLLVTAIVLVLTYDQVMYQLNKGSIAGPKYKVWPIIGPFLESLDPKF